MNKTYLNHAFGEGILKKDTNEYISIQFDRCHKLLGLDKVIITFYKTPKEINRSICEKLFCNRFDCLTIFSFYGSLKNLINKIGWQNVCH